MLVCKVKVQCSQEETVLIYFCGVRWPTNGQAQRQKGKNINHLLKHLTYSSNAPLAFTAYLEPSIGSIQQERGWSGTRYRGLHPTGELTSVASVGESTSVATGIAQEDSKAKHLQRACAYAVRPAVLEDPKARCFATVEF